MLLATSRDACRTVRSASLPVGNTPHINKYSEYNSRKFVKLVVYNKIRNSLIVGMLATYITRVKVKDCCTSCRFTGISRNSPELHFADNRLIA
jgi:hypothetical protein